MPNDIGGKAPRDSPECLLTAGPGHLLAAQQPCSKVTSI